MLFNLKVLQAQDKFDEVIKIQENISFEDIYSNKVAFSQDESGNFIVTNAKAKKVGIFNSEGELLSQYGKAGKGPGDFLQPITTIRLSSGQLLTAELAGKLSLFNPRGDSLIKVFNIKVLPVSEIHQIDENEILIVGRRRFQDQVKLLHIFDLSKGTLTKSFLDLPFSVGDYGGIFRSFASLSTVAIKDDRITAVIAPFKKLYVFNYDGKLLETTNLSLKYFKNIRKEAKQLSPRELDKYATTFSMIEDLFWRNDGKLIISYFRFTNFKFPKIMETKNNLAILDLDENETLEVANTPKSKTFHPPYLFFENENDVESYSLIKSKIVLK